VDVPQRLIAHVIDDDVAGVLDALARGADVDARETPQGLTPLMHAVRHAGTSIGLMRLLIARGADVKARDEVGNTVLIRAAKSCALPVVEALVDAGADIRAMNKEGLTPLAVALGGQNWDVAEYLVERGARLKKADIDAIFFEPPTDEKQLAIIRRATSPVR
jgi:ankyrin repeat protein